MAAMAKNTRASGDAIWEAELAFGTLVDPVAVELLPDPVLVPVLDALVLAGPVLVAFDLPVEDAVLVEFLVIELTKDETEEATEEMVELAAADWDERTEETEETAEETTEEAEEAGAPPINWN